MGEFRRQPSKVWWSTYDDDDDDDITEYSGYLGWGKSIDLSNNVTSSKPETGTIESKDVSVEKKGGGEEGEEAEKNKRKSLESDRGSSSSPSQGSHKSQDSGFSDSEIHNNAISISPENSPELSGRMNFINRNSRSINDDAGAAIRNQIMDDKSRKEKSHNETVSTYRKLKTCVKITNQFKVVEFNPETYNEPIKPCLETAFDGNDNDVNTPKKENSKENIESSTVQKIFKNSQKENLFTKSQSRSKFEAKGKIQQIQNQLESSLKLPKKINLSQNLKIPNLFHGKPVVNVIKNSGLNGKAKIKSTDNPSTKFKYFSSCVVPPPPASEKSTNKKSNRENFLDSEGFKVPKIPNDQCSIGKGNNHLLDNNTFIDGPPLSTSTPKSNKHPPGGSSESPKTIKTTGKKISSAKTTYATVRKLKGLSEKKLKGSKNLENSFNR